MPNGFEGQDQLGRIQNVQSRGSRNSGGARPQSMFEPRNQERLFQKSNKVSFYLFFIKITNVVEK